MSEARFLMTEYFRALRTRPDRAIIRNDWIKQAIERPVREAVQADGRIRTLYIEFRSAEVAETRELDENTLLDIDAHGNLCGLTLEHARECADIPHVTFEQVAA
jgi:uncharacterized protein YuzE